jgi:prevent-host-death family protein
LKLSTGSPERQQSHRAVQGAALCDRRSTGATGATILVARGRVVTERVSTIDVRQRIGDLLNRVALRHDEFVIERKGKPLAALVPIERLEQMRRFARRHALEFLGKQKQRMVTEEQALEIALEAQRSARKRVRKPRRGTR